MTKDELIRLRKSEAYRLLRQAKQSNCALAANGSMYDRSAAGIMPEITASMFAGRKAYKNKMLDIKRSAEAVKKLMETDRSGELRSKLSQMENEISSSDAMQHAFKIALNSLN